MPEEYEPRNQETDPNYNREPGIALVPGSAFLQEVSKFEQFDSKFTMGTNGPGNRYVYRPYPKMLYKAHKYNGTPACMAAPPDPYEKWRDHTELIRAQEAAQRFNESCQMIVRSKEEHERYEREGWRESPQEALDYIHALDKAVSTAAAHRAYEDRNVSERAKAELKAAHDEVGGMHVPEKIADHVDSPTETIKADGQCNHFLKSGKRCSFKTKGLYCGKHVDS